MHGTTIQNFSSPQDAALRGMFAARKRVFVDILKWDVPVLAGEFEVDQFDNTQAEYLVLTDPDGEHLASARLLRTDRPHILWDLYAHLCDRPIPAGPCVREITRFCLDPRPRAPIRRRARNALVTALAERALSEGITDYTGVASFAWFEQIAEFGWVCDALGPPIGTGPDRLVALHISIDQDTLSRLKGSGIFMPPSAVFAAPSTGEG
jgi:acyl homoserine lactone synthase/acyl-homoserine lactone synthase